MAEDPLSPVYDPKARRKRSLRSSSVTVRRLHDTNRSGWWVMLYWGPLLVMFIIPFVVGADLATKDLAWNLLLGDTPGIFRYLCPFQSR